MSQGLALSSSTPGAHIWKWEAGWERKCEIATPVTCRRAFILTFIPAFLVIARRTTSCPCFRSTCCLDKMPAHHLPYRILTPPLACREPRALQRCFQSALKHRFLFKFCLLCLNLCLLESSAYLFHPGEFKNSVNPDARVQHIMLIFKTEQGGIKVTGGTAQKAVKPRSFVPGAV